MKSSRRILLVTLLSFLGVALVFSSQETSAREQFGQVDFPISCSAKTQQQFNRAVAILHSFWYAEALKAFTAIIETEPDCAMGYWGIAMSHWYPLWQPPSAEMLQKGRAAVEKAKASGPKTDREQAYITAIDSFYKDFDTLDHRTRALAYEKAMEQLHQRYPDDREGAVFYALALNATVNPNDKTYTNQLKAAAILEKIFVEQPNHPGVAHYLIHSYDYPPLAERALPAAQRYAKIAPSVPHALHMPSHIFIRLGLWPESIQSNRDSAAAAKKHGSIFEALHAMDYLMYAYLQSAQDRAAQQVLEERNALGQLESENVASAYAFAAIPARYALERRQWSEAASLEPQPSRLIYPEAITSFARAIGSARSGDVGGTRREVEKLQALRERLGQAKQHYWAEQVEIQRLAAAAWLSWAEGDYEEALKLMQSAAALEDSTEKHPVTPGEIIPAHELLGELLLELGKPDQALRAFETSLQDTPNRFNSFYGAARAAERLGDLQKAKDLYEKLIALSEHADSERPALQQAKAFLVKQQAKR